MQKHIASLIGTIPAEWIKQGMDLGKLLPNKLDNVNLIQMGEKGKKKQLQSSFVI